MKTIARNDNQVTLIYSSATRKGKRTLGHLEAIKDKKLLPIDIVKDRLTGTQWVELAEDMGKPLKEILSFDEVTDEEKISEADYDTNDYVNIINNNPKLLAHPIVIWGEKVVQINNPTDVQELINVDSAGLDKKMMQDEPVISNQTKNESWINKPDL